MRGKKGKRDGTGANTAGESIGSSDSFLRPVSQIATGGHDGEGSRTGKDTRQVHSRNRSPQPEPVPVGGRGSDGEGKGVDVGAHLEPNVEIVVGGGPSPAPLSPSPAQLLHGGKPESTWTRLFYLIYLTVPSDNTESSAVPDQVPGVVSSDESAKPGPVASEEKSNWKTTAAATAKLLLRGVCDSADAFGPLKSVAGGLCFVLDNCEVRPPLPIPH